MAFDVLCYILMFVVIIDIMELNGGIMGGICMHDAVYFFCCRILKQDSFVFGTWPVYSSKVQMMPAALWPLLSVKLCVKIVALIVIVEICPLIDFSNSQRFAINYLIDKESSCTSSKNFSRQVCSAG